LLRVTRPLRSTAGGEFLCLQYAQILRFAWSAAPPRAELPAAWLRQAGVLWRAGPSPLQTSPPPHSLAISPRAVVI